MEREVVKGFQWNFSSFLWKEINRIREQQTIGNHFGALILACDFIDYLPNAVKEAFEKEAQDILLTMRWLRANIKGSDLWTTAIKKNRVLQTVSKKLLKTFMSKLTTMLDERGYMEKVKSYKKTKFEG